MHFTIVLQIQDGNNFLPTIEYRKAKVRRFLFLVRLLHLWYKFRFPKISRRHLGSGRKTVNSQEYSEFTGANQNARKLLFIDLVNTRKN